MPMTAELPDLATRLRSLRDAAELTQQELANTAGLSISLVAQIESGKNNDPKLSTLLKLAAALGLTYDDLLRADAPPPKRRKKPRP